MSMPVVWLVFGILAPSVPRASGAGSSYAGQHQPGSFLALFFLCPACYLRIFHPCFSLPAHGFVARCRSTSQSPLLPSQVHTSPTKPKEQMMRPTQTQPSSTQREDRTTPRRRKSTSSRAALVSMRCPTVDGYYWPYLNATETVMWEVATSLCLFFCFFLEKKKASGKRKRRRRSCARLGGSGICCVKIFLVKYTLLFDTSVCLGFLFLAKSSLDLV